MDAIIDIIKVLTPLVIGVFGIGSIGKIILKHMDHKNDEKKRKEEQILIIKRNMEFYNKLFDKIAENIRLWQSELIKQERTESHSYSTEKIIGLIDYILGASIVDFNNENDYLGIPEKMSLKYPLQARGVY